VQWLTAIALANGRRLDPKMPFLPVEVEDTFKNNPYFGKNLFLALKDTVDEGVDIVVGGLQESYKGSRER